MKNVEQFFFCKTLHFRENQVSSSKIYQIYVYPMQSYFLENGTLNEQILFYIFHFFYA